MSWGLVLALGIAVIGVAFIAYQVALFVRYQRLWRKADEMAAEYRILGQDLLELKRQFDTKYQHLAAEDRSRLWKPVSDEVVRSINALTSDPVGDPMPALREAVRLAQELVSRSA